MKFISLLFTLLAFPILAYSQSGNELTEAISASKKGDYESALKFIDQAILLDSTNGDLYNKKGYFLGKLKRDAEAINTYTKGIYFQPRFADLYWNRGTIFMNYLFTDDAIHDFNMAIEYEDNDTLVNALYTYRGLAKEDKHDYEGSYNDLLRTYKVDSTKVQFLGNLADVCVHLSKIDEALKYLQIAYAALPNDPVTISNFGFFYQTQGDYIKSIEYFDKCLKINPEDGIAFSNRSYSLLKLGKLEKAMEDINMALGIYPENSYAYRTRGLIWLELKKYASACEDFNTAISKNYTKKYGPDVEELIQKNCTNLK
jgi:tetratricopeptide (TPR) repeat protein